MMFFFFFKQKTAYELRISDWSSDVCSSDLQLGRHHQQAGFFQRAGRHQVFGILQHGGQNEGGHRIDEFHRRLAAVPGAEKFNATFYDTIAKVGWIAFVDQVDLRRESLQERSLHQFSEIGLVHVGKKAELPTTGKSEVRE